MKAEARRALTSGWLDAFVVAAALLEGESPGEAGVAGADDLQTSTGELSTRLQHMLQQERARLLDSGVPLSVVDDAELAVVALLDEAAFNHRRVRTHWKSLQLTLFGHTRAGEEVFRRLQALRVDPQTPTALLQLYQRCLLWGFQGRFAASQAAELQQLREGLAIDIQRRATSGEPLLAQPSPQKVPPPVQRVLHPLAVAALTLLFVLVLLGGMRLSLSSQVNQTASKVEQTRQLLVTAAGAASTGAPPAVLPAQVSPVQVSAPPAGLPAQPPLSSPPAAATPATGGQ